MFYVYQTCAYDDSGFMGFNQLMSEPPMPEQPLPCQLPLAWQIQLETIAQRTGQSVEQVIYQAIGRYLGQRSPESVPEDDEIDDEPDEILTGFLESDEFQDRVRQAIAPPQSADGSPLDEESDNESGEVLYDFLES
jgi:hypothetical protein